MQNNLGKISEELVANLLQKDRFVILKQNYKRFFGEIDIIAKKDDIIVFVEVKARTNPKKSMYELVTPAKQQKIIKVAQEFIAHNNFENMTYRFDVALVKCQGNKKEISYISNAFYQKEE